MAGLYPVVLLPELPPTLGLPRLGGRRPGLKICPRPRATQRRRAGKNLHGLRRGTSRSGSRNLRRERQNVKRNLLSHFFSLFTFLLVTFHRSPLSSPLTLHVSRFTP